MSCLKEIVGLIKEVLSVPNYFRLCPNMKLLILCLDENQIKIVNIVSIGNNCHTYQLG